MNAVAHAILDLLADKAPADRIVARADLDGLGAPAAVDAALQALQQDNRIGSPAPGWYMSLEPWTDRHGRPRYAPPALLRDMLRAVLVRNGVTPGPGPGELAVARARRAGRQGLDVPNYIHVGTDRPFPLALRWGPGRAATAHNGEFTPMPPVDHSHACGITDVAAFMQAARAFGVDPARTEKDLYVNGLLQAVGSWSATVAGPEFGLTVVLHGGTCLTKGHGLLERFSEDIDMYLFPAGYNPQDAECRSPVDVQTATQATRSLQEHVLAALKDDMPQLAAGHYTVTDDNYRRQHKPSFVYTGLCAGEPDTLLLDMDFWPPPRLETAMYAIRRGGAPRPLRNVPSVLEVPIQPLTYMPLAPVPVILAGKLWAIVDDVCERLSADAPDPEQARNIRHTLDLYACASQLEPKSVLESLLAAMQDTGTVNADTWYALQQAGPLLESGDLYGPDAYADFALTMLTNDGQLRYGSNSADAYRHLDLLVNDLAALAGHTDRQEPDTDSPRWDPGAM